jgi:mannosyl-oligosaccharide alpha-1,2-mannosidase
VKPIDRIIHPGFFKPAFRWKNVKQKHPVDTFTPLPTGKHVTLPQVQHDFGPEKAEHAQTRRHRQKAVKKAFEHSWDGYKHNAWLQDEVGPLTGKAKNPFGGMGATLVDSLDTLWIMGMKKEFKKALSSLKKIDFVTSTLLEVNVFETTIRYLGGLLSAYDVSGHQYGILLDKATELGEMLYLAFDTPNRMPVARWKWQSTALGYDQEAKKSTLLAEIGSLTLEFTRLSQLTNDPKYYDAIARITNHFEESQNKTNYPGLWPTNIDAMGADFVRGTSFTLGGMADSMYEYLPKQHMLLAGQTDQYKNMYSTALEAAKQKIFFRPLTRENKRILIPGTVKKYPGSSKRTHLIPQAEHLGCFAGGMVAVGAKIFGQAHDMKTARELVDGCLWAYEAMPSGIMPEVFTALPCLEYDLDKCTWDESTWQKDVLYKASRGLSSPGESYVEEANSLIKQNALVPGISEIKDARYILRPEAIESVFVMYRITGDQTLQDKVRHHIYYRHSRIQN